MREDIGIRAISRLPAYPGGDYESYDYTGKVVIDNRLAILAKIVKFYQKRESFLFAPSLTCLPGVGANGELYSRFLGGKQQRADL